MAAAVSVGSLVFCPYLCQVFPISALSLEREPLTDWMTTSVTNSRRRPSPCFAVYLGRSPAWPRPKQTVCRQLHGKLRQCPGCFSGKPGNLERTLPCPAFCVGGCGVEAQMSESPLKL